MSEALTLALANGYHLAQTLMVYVVVFRASLGYGTMVASEYDGDPEAIVHEFDPYAK